MDGRYDSTVASFVREAAERRQREVDAISVLKSRHQDDMQTLYDFLAAIAFNIHEQKIAIAELRPAEIEYDLQSMTVTATFYFVIDGKMHSISYFGTKNKTNVEGKDFDVGGYDLPYLHVRGVIDSWLKKTVHREQLG